MEARGNSVSKECYKLQEDNTLKLTGTQVDIEAFILDLGLS